MREVAIIGAGRLGSRHLQALATLDTSIRVTVVEQVQTAVDIARSRWGEVATPTSPPIAWVRDVGDLPAVVDVAIVATAADVRRAIVEQMFAHGRVKHLVLEKVLFQRVSDYEPMARLIASSTASAWVNCPRRMWPFYRAVRERLSGELRMTVSGSQWGLGSSAVHFLDLYAFLGGGDELAVDALITAPASTWRAGFSELTGQLTGHSARGSFGIASLAEGELPVSVEIASPRLRAYVREGDGKAWLATAEDKWAWREQAVDIAPQSRLSHRIVGDLIATATCDLTPLAASVQHHVAFLSALAKNLGDERCPIT